MSIYDNIINSLKGKSNSKGAYRALLEEQLNAIDFKNSDDDIDTANITPNGSLYFFSYRAEYPYNYPYYDRYPMLYIINIDPSKGKLFGANLHYLFPDIRPSVAKSLINKGGEWRGIAPTICLHTYFIKNCDSFLKVPSKEWENLSKLPVQDFRDPRGRYVSESKVWSGNE